NGKVCLETNLAGPGSHTAVTGAYATRGRQHVDFDTLQEHAAPNTTSDLAFRGILDGRSTAVWRGMIKVDPGAQQTDAFQESRNLLLSKKAHADAIPGLEILANDVRCTHAAATSWTLGRSAGSGSRHASIASASARGRRRSVPTAGARRCAWGWGSASSAGNGRAQAAVWKSVTPRPQTSVAGVKRPPPTCS